MPFSNPKTKALLIFGSLWLLLCGIGVLYIVQGERQQLENDKIIENLVRESERRRAESRSHIEATAKILSRMLNQLDRIEEKVGASEKPK